MVRILRLAIFIGMLLTVAACNAAAEDSTDLQSSGQTEYIENKGSDTMVNLALSWAEEYQALNPGMSISVTGGGSGTGIAPLLNGTVDIANASRAIKTEEIESALSAGFEPVEYTVALDAIAVIVHPDNPVSSLTMVQISKIYLGEITNWSQVGGEDRPIVKLSRETNSGTHTYFLETVIRLGNEDSTDIFSADTLLLPSSEGIIAEVSSNPNAIGYDGLGYVTDTVKVLAIAPQLGEEYVYPSVATVIDDTYPIARELYMYTRGEPEGAVKSYLEWILSNEAQAIVEEQGFVPYEQLP